MAEVGALALVVFSLCLNSEYLVYRAIAYISTLQLIGLMRMNSYTYPDVDVNQVLEGFSHF